MSVAVGFLAASLSAQVPRPGGLDLEALAERIDPGPQPPLYTSLPESVREWLLRGGPHGSVRDAAGRLLAPQKPERDGIDLYTSVLRDALVIERAVAEGESDEPELRQALLRGYGAIASVSNASFRASARVARAPDPEALGHLETVSKEGWLLAERNLARMAAELLRDGTEAGIEGALELMSTAEMRAENLAPALGLFEERMRRLGERARPRDWIRLAKLYYVSLEFELGDLALQRSRQPMESLPTIGVELWNDHRERVKVREQGLVLRDLQRSAGQEGLDGQLAQAKIWSRVGLHRRAVGLYEALAQEQPGDARPLTGLAVDAARVWDLARARGLLARAANLDHKGTTYYGLSFFLSLMWDLPRLRQTEDRGDTGRLMEALRRLVDDTVIRTGDLDEGMGAAMSLIAEIFGVGTEGQLQTYMTELLPRAVAIRERFPHLVPAHTLAIGSAVFHRDGPLALDAVLDDLPERSDRFPELALGRAMTYLALCLRQGQEPVELDRLTRELARDQGAAFDRDLLLGTAAALRARRSDAEDAWQQAMTLLQRSVPPDGMPHRGWALNNLAFAVHRLGRVDEAIGLWRRAEASPEAEYGVLTVNRLAANLTGGAGDRQALRELGELTIRDEVRRPVKIQALCWLGIAAEDEDPDSARELFRQAVALLDQRESLSGLPAFASDGVAVIGRTQFGLGYTTENGIYLQFDSSPELWLILSAPIDEQALREKAAR